MCSLNCMIHCQCTEHNVTALKPQTSVASVDRHFSQMSTRKVIIGGLVDALSSLKAESEGFWAQAPPTSSVHEEGEKSLEVTSSTDT